MAITVEEALEKIYTLAASLGTEIEPIENAVHRVLAQSVTASRPLPSFDNSAMDGYAVRVEDAGKTLSQIRTVFAGDQEDVRLVEEQCIRIMTGARIPAGCEAVVPIEEVRTEGENVTFPPAIKAGQHIRLRGEDIEEGMILLEEGTLLCAHHIALLASQGLHTSLSTAVPASPSSPRGTN